jgi:hypothetical protein
LLDNNEPGSLRYAINQTGPRVGNLVRAWKHRLAVQYRNNDKLNPGAGGSGTAGAVFF